MNTNFIPGPVDESTRLEASITKAATFAGTTLDLGDGYAPGGAGQEFSAVIDTSAWDHTTGDETYAAKVQESVDGGTTWTDASPSVSITGVGVVAIPVFISGRLVRLSLTLAGTTPSITYEAWLVPHQD